MTSTNDSRSEIAASEIWSQLWRNVGIARRRSPLPFGDFTMVITMSTRCASEFEYRACVALARLQSSTGEVVNFIVGGQPQTEWIVWRYDDTCVDERLQLDRYTIEVRPMVNQPNHIYRNMGRLLAYDPLFKFQGTISWFELSGRTVRENLQ